MTHFCAAKNQTRLKAAHIDAGAGNARFSVVDVTNATPNGAYVDEFSIHIVDADNLKLEFDFGGSSGKRAVESIVLRSSPARRELVASAVSRHSVSRHLPASEP